MSTLSFASPSSSFYTGSSFTHHDACIKACFLTPIHQTKKNPLFLKAQPLNHVQPRRFVVVMSMEAGIGVMATKLGMMSYFEPNGTIVPVTVVGFREGNIVTQIKTVATDGYDAVQIGYRRVRDRKLTKPEMGHLEKAGAIPMRHLQEFRLQRVDGFTPNQRIVFDEIFEEGDLVDVSGTTIGKGFQGAVCLYLSHHCISITCFCFLFHLRMLCSLSSFIFQFSRYTDSTVFICVIRTIGYLGYGNSQKKEKEIHMSCCPPFVKFFCRISLNYHSQSFLVDDY